MQQVANGAFLSTGKTVQSQGICDAWGCFSTSQTGKKEKPARYFSANGVRIWTKRSNFDLCCAAMENQSSFADVSEAAVIFRAKIGPSMSYRKIHFFPSERILRSSLGNLIEKMFCPGKLNIFERSNNQKRRSGVLNFSFCPSLTADSTVGQKQY